MEIADISPMPIIKIQKIMEFAMLIAARVFVECFAAINTSVAPISTCPRLPIISGTESFIISEKYFLYDINFSTNCIVNQIYHNKTVKQSIHIKIFVYILAGFII